MRHYRMLGAQELAKPAVKCAGCPRVSQAAARHPQKLCLLCEAKKRRKEGR